MAKPRESKRTGEQSQSVKASRKRSSNFVDAKLRTFIDLEHLLVAMGTEKSIAKSLQTVHGLRQGRQGRTTSELRRTIENYLGVELTKPSGTGRARALDNDPTVEKLKTIVGLARKLKEGIDDLAKHAYPELRIGTWTSIGRYLIPALIHGFQSPQEAFSDSLPTKRKGSKRDCKTPVDIHLTFGTSATHLRNIQLGEIDFAILPSNDERAAKLGLEEIELSYRRKAEGITFLHQIRNDPGPFPKLSAFVERPETFSCEGFFHALIEYPIVIMDTEDRHGHEEFETIIGNVFSRRAEVPTDVMRVPRYQVPTYLHERLFVSKGLAVGFGLAPKQKVATISLGRQSSVQLGRDYNDSVVLAHVDLSAIEGKLETFAKFEDQRFSIYARKGFGSENNDNGLSDVARTAIELIKDDICVNRSNRFGYLEYGDDQGKPILIHDYT